MTRFIAFAGPIGIGLAVYLIQDAGSLVESLAALVVYAFMCELYMFLVTLAGNSVSATLLLLLWSGPIAIEEIDSRLGGASMVAFRIEGLVATGFLRETGVGYVLTNEGRAVISLFTRLRRFFGQER